MTTEIIMGLIVGVIVAVVIGALIGLVAYHLAAAHVRDLRPLATTETPPEKATIIGSGWPQATVALEPSPEAQTETRFAKATVARGRTQILDLAREQGLALTEDEAERLAQDLLRQASPYSPL